MEAVQSGQASIFSFIYQVVGGLNKLDKALFNKERILGGSDNLNSITQGIYSYYVENGIPHNAPSGLQRGIIIVFESNISRAQIIMDFGNKRTYQRVDNSGVGNAWCDWY